MDVQAELLTIVSAELTQARAKNPQYSLRAFARRVGLHPSALSEILSGRRPFTKMTGGKILDRIDVAPEQAIRLRAALKGKHRSSPHQTVRSRGYHVLTADQIHVLADWYHFAIRELARTHGFTKDPAWIATRLGLRKRDAAAALRRLERLKLLDEEPVQVTTTHDVHSSVLQRAHRQHMELAIEALNDVDVAERDITGITMAIDPAKLPEAKRRIMKFRRELCEFLEDGKKSEVFRLNVQLFPMTKKKEKV